MLSFACKIDRQLPVFFYLSESAAMQREWMDHFSTGMQVSTDSIEKLENSYRHIIDFQTCNTVRAKSIRIGCPNSNQFTLSHVSFTNH
jgi:hypothetical protein